MSNAAAFLLTLWLLAVVVITLTHWISNVERSPQDGLIESQESLVYVLFLLLAVHVSKNLSDVGVQLRIGCMYTQAHHILQAGIL